MNYSEKEKPEQVPSSDAEKERKAGEIRYQTESRLELLALQEGVKAYRFDELKGVRKEDFDRAAQAVEDAYEIIKTQVLPNLEEEAERLRKEAPQSSDLIDKLIGLKVTRSLSENELNRRTLYAFMGIEGRFKEDTGLFRLRGEQRREVEKHFGAEAENRGSSRDAVLGLLYWGLCRYEKTNFLDRNTSNEEKDKLALDMMLIGPQKMEELWKRFGALNVLDFKLKLSGAIHAQIGRDADTSSTLLTEKGYGIRYREYAGVRAYLDPQNAGRLNEKLMIEGEETSITIREAGMLLHRGSLMEVLVQHSEVPERKTEKPPRHRFRTDRLYDYRQNGEYQELVSYGRDREKLSYKGRDEMIRQGVVVPVEANLTKPFAFPSAESPGVKERYLRPYALEELNRIAREFHEKTGGYKLVITSLFRTPEEQQAIAGHNEAATTGVSTHTFANSFDIPDGRFMTPDNRIITWTGNPEMRDKIEQTFRPLIKEILLNRQRAGGSMTFQEEISWHVMAVNPERGDEFVEEAETTGSSSLDSLSADDLYAMINRKPEYASVDTYEMMRYDRYMEDPVIRAYMETATYHDLLRHKFILPGDETEQYGYLNVSQMWERKFQLVNGSETKRTSMGETWENIRRAPSETLTLETYRETMEEVWNEMLPRLQRAGLVNRFTESITPDTIFAISIHELAPTHKDEGKGYHALGRVHTMRTLMDEGFQPQRTPAIHDTAASYGVGQTIRDTHNGLRNKYNKYMPVEDQIPVFEKSITLRDQLEVMIWFAFENLGAVDDYFKGDFFEQLYANSTENERMRFFSSVIAAMHNAGNTSVTRAVMRKTFQGRSTGSDPERADFWVDGNPNTKDICENLEDARIAYLNILGVNGKTMAKRHGIQVVEIYEVLNEREGRTTSPTVADRTERPERGDIIDTHRRLARRAHKGREYFVFSVPSWKLERLGGALFSRYDEAARKDVGEFNNFQMAAGSREYRFKPKDVIWIPIDLMKSELRSGEFVTVRVRDAQEARTKIKKLCKDPSTAEDVILLYSNDKSYSTFDEVKSKIRIPKALLKENWETIANGT